MSSRIGYAGYSISELQQLLRGIAKFKFSAGRNDIIETPDIFVAWVKKTFLNAKDLKALLEQHLSSHAFEINNGFVEYSNVVSIYINEIDDDCVCKVSLEISSRTPLTRVVVQDLIHIEAILNEINLEYQAVPQSWLKYVFDPESAYQR